MSLNDLHKIFFKQAKDGKPGLWANIHAKRKRGESPAKKGSEDYPDAKSWNKVTSEKSSEAIKKASPAWQTSEGKNPEGGLNEKGRKSLKAEGHDIKRPQPEGGARKDSFCARMKGMKSKLTSDETANDPDSRINKSLRKWKCGSDNRFAFAYLTPIEKAAFMRKQAIGEYMSNIGSSLMNYYNQLHPAAQSAVIGAGIGGAGNILLGDRRKSILNRLLTGGALGGAVGGLGQLGYDYLTADPDLKHYNKGEFVGPPSSLKNEPAPASAAVDVPRAGGVALGALGAVPGAAALGYAGSRAGGALGNKLKMGKLTPLLQILGLVGGAGTGAVSGDKAINNILK